MQHPPAPLPGRLRFHAAPAAVLATGLAVRLGGGRCTSPAWSRPSRRRGSAPRSPGASTRSAAGWRRTPRCCAPTRGLFEGDRRGARRRDVRAVRREPRDRPALPGDPGARVVEADLRPATSRATRRSCARPASRTTGCGRRASGTSTRRSSSSSRATGATGGRSATTCSPIRRAGRRWSARGTRARSRRRRGSSSCRRPGSTGRRGSSCTSRSTGALRGRPRSGRRLLLGWVYAPFRAADLLAGTLEARDASAVGLAIYDGPEVRPDALLHDAAPADAARRSAGGAARDRRAALDAPVRGDAGVRVAHRARAPRHRPRRRARGRRPPLLDHARGRPRPRAGRARGAAVGVPRRRGEGALGVDRLRVARVAEVAGLAARKIADACLVLLLEPQGPTWIAGHADPATAARAAALLRGEGPATTGALGVPAALARAAPARGGGPGPPGAEPPSAARAAPRRARRAGPPHRPALRAQRAARRNRAARRRGPPRLRARGRPARGGPRAARRRGGGHLAALPPRAGGGGGPGRVPLHRLARAQDAAHLARPPHRQPAGRGAARGARPGGVPGGPHPPLGGPARAARREPARHLAASAPGGSTSSSRRRTSPRSRRR